MKLQMILHLLRLLDQFRTDSPISLFPVYEQTGNVILNKPDKTNNHIIYKVKNSTTPSIQTL